MSYIPKQLFTPQRRNETAEEYAARLLLSHNKMQIDLQRADKRASRSVSRDISIATSSLVSGSGSSTVVDFHRADSVSVVAGSQTILFANPLTGSYQIVLCLLYGASEVVSLLDKTSNQISTGFTVQVPEDGTLHYAVLSATTSDNHRAGTFTAVLGSNTITFLTMSGTYRVIECILFGASGAPSLIDKITNQTSSSFTVDCPESGTIWYAILLDK